MVDRPLGTASATAGLESAVNLLTQFADVIERQDGDAAYALLEQGLIGSWPTIRHR